MSKFLCAASHSICDSRSADVSFPGVGRKNISRGCQLVLAEVVLSEGRKSDPLI